LVIRVIQEEEEENGEPVTVPTAAKDDNLPWKSESINVYCKLLKDNDPWNFGGK
jgi:hypothetical protein